jgi:RNAse (barnase) inhibitor barstar
VIVAAKLHLNGALIKSEAELHDEIEKQLKPPVYGRNLNALDEVLLQMLEPPIEIVWTDAANSKEILSDKFEEFLAVFRDAGASYGSNEYHFDLRMD